MLCPHLQATSAQSNCMFVLVRTLQKVRFSKKIYGCETSQNAVDAEAAAQPGNRLTALLRMFSQDARPCARTVHGLFSKWSWAASVLHFQRAKRVRHVSRTAEHRLNSKTNAKALVQNHAHVADSHNTRFPSPRAGSLTHASCGI